MVGATGSPQAPAQDRPAANVGGEYSVLPIAPELAHGCDQGRVVRRCNYRDRPPEPSRRAARQTGESSVGTEATAMTPAEMEAEINNLRDQVSQLVRRMTTSQTISGLIGPTFIAIAVSMLLNLGSLPALIEQAYRDPAVVLLSGIIIFVAGLAIVRTHNLWKAGWPVLVTVLGWLFMVQGLARMLFPTQLAAIAAGIAQNAGFIVGEAVVILALGCFLSFKAYRQG
jgi:hypothetical protein